MDSFDRNFDLNDDMVDKTISKSPIDKDEFSFVKPPETPIKPNPFTSPSKSALRKTNSNSPKKNVVFTSSGPEVIHYPHGESEVDADQEEQDKLFSNQIEQTLNHQWKQVRQASISSEETTPPPNPPPHSINLNDVNYQATDDLDTDKLQKFKLHLKNLDNLSLNEKLDFFLSNKKDSNQELDQYLQELDDKSKEELNSNIHHLSLDLQNKLGNKVENPLNSLSNTYEVPLKSAGSSQSSLQSLLEDNRYLPSDFENQKSPGITLNDGIHGFSNDLVEQLIPQSQSTQFTNSDESQLLSFNTNAKRLSKQSLQSEEEFHDSFDNEYNNTEQSIMDLLASANKPQVSVKPEPEDDVEIKLEPEETVSVKQEPQEEAIQDQEEHQEQEEHQAQEDVKPELPADISHDIEKPVLKTPASDEESLVANDTYDDDLEIQESKFRIGDHIESGWKFEESLDADREDNDEFTNNDITMISQKTIDPAVTDSEDELNNGLKRELLASSELELLNVDLSPTSDKSFEDSPDRVSLAPPRSEASLPNSPIRPLNSASKRIDIGIDATTPPTPVRKAREARLKEMYGSVSPPPLPQLPSQTEVEPTVEETPLNTPKIEAPIQEDETLVNEGNTENPVAITASENDGNDSAEKEESEILANSTNVQAPEEITLPPIEPNNYSSFEEITRTLNNSKNEDSFEQSLSAEYDEEKAPKSVDYLSIWHSQDKGKPKNPLHLSRASLDAANISVYDPATNSLRIPSALLNKKVKEVNLVSSKVIDPNEVEREGSGFLPDYSQDSGFEQHFNHLIANDLLNSSFANTSGQRLSKTPLSERNVLSNLEENKSGESVLVPESIASTTSPSAASPPLYPTTLKPQPLPKKPITQISQKRSKFKVPSFEIKRSISQAEQKHVRDTYDDIFDDTADLEPKKPTIKGHGMKTLPSMDKDDVKKIFNTKQIISQEEYSQVKLVGRKSSVIHDNKNNFDSLQQQATIHDADNSMDSVPLTEMEVLPHLKTELTKDPKALLSKEQIFNDSDLYSNQAPGSNLSSRLSSSAVPPQINTSIQFPEPSPDIVSSPSNIFKTPPKDTADTPDEILDTKEINKENKPPVSPQKGKPGSPIKIRSPIKMVKKNSVTSVVMNNQIPETSSMVPSSTDRLSQVVQQSPVDQNLSKKEFNGNEIVNNKLRNRDLDQVEPQHEKKLSVVSVPSMYTSNTVNTGPSHTSSNTLFNLLKPLNDWKQHSVQSSVLREHQESLPMERGRLFFRVVGLKNVHLPDIQDHNAEFSVTLDNGVHCIKTPNYKIESLRVLIGKEFELTVGESLEFILTMKMTYEKPKGKLVEVKERKVVKSKNKIGRMFGSKDVITTTKFVPHDPVDTWKSKFAQDGSFGRCYIDLNQYESKITYKTNSFDVPCFNEWEILNTSSGTMKAKPYVIGNLEVKMLFIPRSELHESLPTSMRSAGEIVDQLVNENNIRYEGYLSQDGGDCESLKRRFFKLEGSSLIAHSEFSHKTRAKINLTKIIDVIYYDNNRPETTAKARNFSDVLLVPDSFKIKFANGEMIDFGAPNKSEKYQWIKYLETIAQHNRYRRLPWVKKMLEIKNSKNPWIESV